MASEEMERLMAVADTVNEGKLQGHGSGNEVVATIAAVLANACQYEFKFIFWKAD